MEVYEPDETDGAPRSFEADHSVSCSTLARHDEQALESYEDAMDDFRDAHGWDDEYERFERVTGRDHRCERCEGLVSLFEDDLGYCLISPGELPEAHLEYIEEQGGDEMLWKRGRDGILNPVRMTRLDFAKCEARRRWRNFKYLTWHGGWKHRARYVWFPRVKRKLDGVSRA